MDYPRTRTTRFNSKNSFPGLESMCPVVHDEFQVHPGGGGALEIVTPEHEGSGGETVLDFSSLDMFRLTNLERTERGRTTRTARLRSLWMYQTQHHPDPPPSVSLVQDLLSTRTSG